MSIVSDIETFSNKLDVKFAKAHHIKLYRLVLDIQRQIVKEFKGDRNLQFTSQQLRVLVIAIDKTLKAVNKIVSFWEFQKKFEKYKKVSSEEVWNETKKLGKYCGTAKYLQACYSILNHMASLVYLIELEDKQQKVISDKEFEDVAMEALLCCMGGEK